MVSPGSWVRVPLSLLSSDIAQLERARNKLLISYILTFNLIMIYDAETTVTSENCLQNKWL